MNNLENLVLEGKLKLVQQELKEKGIYSERKIQEKDEISFAFVVYTLERFLGNYNIDEIISDITEGGNDNNIDIFNIDDDNDEDFIYINIFQSKYKKEQNLKATIGENDVKAFLGSIEKLLINGDTENLRLNPNLQNKYDDFIDHTKKQSVQKIVIRLYLVTNGSDINEQEEKTLQSFINKNPTIENFAVLNDYSFFMENSKKCNEPLTLKIADEVLKMNNDINSYIVNFKTYELVSLYEKFNESILAKNPRKLLTGKTNKEIELSLKSEPKMFWYKNNGLSIVCKTMEIKTIGGIKSLIIEDPYIVNGGQTTKTIYNLWKTMNEQERERVFSDSYVMARIYQTTDEEKISAIVYGTNNQNKITLFDLKSTNPNLKKIKNLFAQKEISLLIQRNCEEKKNKLAINSDFLLQLYCAIFKEIPHKSKISKNSIIDDYYDEVYSDPTSADKLLNSFYLYNYVQNMNKENKDVSHLKHSLYSMLYIMTKKNPTLKESFDIEIAKKAYEYAKEILQEITESEKSKTKDYTHNNFFKSEYSTRVINNYLEN